jgi:hypothetical protein
LEEAKVFVGGLLALRISDRLRYIFVGEGWRLGENIIGGRIIFRMG